ncbi:DDE 3 domain containing protein [Asbolus verrucosus]|uniref:DDE 3 domain containing protein n=1 Tax=Asbolus verrucosus TaxID=1661398 RepID=A0A482VHX6_ASBVE|nr:DDE 3 domain containing protein [Asbolus verrucosus]
MHDGRQRVRRLREERRNSAFSVEQHVAHTVGVMVWAAICYGSRSPLVFIQATMTAQQYIQEVLELVVVPYLQDIPNALYQQDNARPHVARVSPEWLEQANVNLLPWPPRSPDSSPIEYVWDAIGHRLWNLAHPSQTLQQLRHKIQVI